MFFRALCARKNLEISVGNFPQIQCGSQVGHKCRFSDICPKWQKCQKCKNITAWSHKSKICDFKLKILIKTRLLPINHGFLRSKKPPKDSPKASLRNLKISKTAKSLISQKTHCQKGVLRSKTPDLQAVLRRNLRFLHWSAVCAMKLHSRVQG